MKRPNVQGLWANNRSPFCIFTQSLFTGVVLLSIIFLSLEGCSTSKPVAETDGTEEPADSVTSPPVKEYNSRAIQHYMEGVNAQMQDNHAMAALEFQEALRYDSTSSTIYTDLAKSYMRLQKFGRAEEYLKKGIHHTGERRELVPILGRVYLASDQLEKAKTVYEGIAENPRDSEEEFEALSRLAEINAQQKNYLEVARLYERIFTNDPDRLQHFMKAKEIYLRLGKHRDAREIYRKAQEEYPNRTEFKIELAKLYAETGKADSAIAMLEPIASDTTSREASLLLGELYF